MKRAELVAMIALFAASAMLGGFLYPRRPSSRVPTPPRKPIKLAITAHDLVSSSDFKGKRADELLANELPRYSGKLRVAVRNLPLSFHKQAQPAAIAAEAAREQGAFWRVHDSLVKQKNLTPALIISHAQFSSLLPRRRGGSPRLTKSVGGFY